MEGFIETAIGPVPVAATRPSLRDRMQTVLARIGPIRNTYAIPPGLYAVGSPSAESPVLVSANYKLSFDALRFELGNVSAWLLVIDTRGINVWCAAGKGTFSTEEIVHSLNRFSVERVVSDRCLIVPQLAGPAVCAADVKARSGFSVLFGPVRSKDLEAYLQNDCEATDKMRMVTFSLKERAELVPVEFYLLLKPLLIILPLCLIISGIGPGLFSIQAMLDRGGLLMAATMAAIVVGGGLVPVLLPWLPGRQFWIKGVLPGFIAGYGVLYWGGHGAEISVGVPLLLWTVTVSSYLAMNFTGSTPFTSPSGVEYEMRRGLPVQVICTIAAAGFWIAQPFI